MKKTKILIILLALASITSGCSISFGGASQTNVNDGGVYKSTDKGQTWTQKVLIPTIYGQPSSIAAVETQSMVMDPSDHLAIYFGSVANGLFYSYDAANDWQIATTLGKVTVNAIAIDPTFKCTIYVAAGNKLFKSIDCSRSWSQVYFDNDLTVRITAVAVDNLSSTNVYIGTSRGEIIKSTDRGANWRTVQRLQNEIGKILINPFDGKTIFVGTITRGIWRSTDGGGSWTDLSDKLKDFPDNRFRDLVLGTATPGLVFLATQYGLIKSTDYGNSWSKIDLITPQAQAVINSVAVSPKNADEIYYVTNTTFYRSLDGGKTWATQKLPTTTRAGWKLLIDQIDSNIIYLGARALK